MIDLNGANAYFHTHLAQEYWKRFSGPQLTAAVAQAKRIIKGRLGYGIELDDATTDDDDFPRHDCAVYEQALHELRRMAVLPENGSPAPVELFPDNKDDPKSGPSGAGPGICRDALFYLAKSTRIQISRG